MALPHVRIKVRQNVVKAMCLCKQPQTGLFTVLAANSPNKSMLCIYTLTGKDENVPLADTNSTPSIPIFLCSCITYICGNITYLIFIYFHNINGLREDVQVGNRQTLKPAFHLRRPIHVYMKRSEFSLLRQANAAYLFPHWQRWKRLNFEFWQRPYFCARITSRHNLLYTDFVARGLKVEFTVGQSQNMGQRCGPLNSCACMHVKWLIPIIYDRSNVLAMHIFCCIWVSLWVCIWDVTSLGSLVLMMYVGQL